MITIDEFQKINLRIGEIKEITGKKVKVFCDGKEFTINLELDAKKGDKILVILDNDKLVIPVVEGNVPIIPEKDVPAGTKVS